MSDSKFRLAVCQIRTRREKQDTLVRAEEMIREAALNGASVVVLPEMFTSLYSHDYFHDYAEPGDGETVQSLSRWAAEYNVILIGGSIPEAEHGRLYNSCFVFDRNGELLARHRKVHMFDIDLKDQFTFNESDSFTAGDDYCVFDTELGKKALPTWGIYVIISRYSDCDGVTLSMPDGISPDYKVSDNPADATPLGNPQEKMLAVALSIATGGPVPASFKSVSPQTAPEPIRRPGFGVLIH